MRLNREMIRAGPMECPAVGLKSTPTCQMTCSRPDVLHFLPARDSYPSLNHALDGFGDHHNEDGDKDQEVDHRQAHHSTVEGMDTGVITSSLLRQLPQRDTRLPNKGCTEHKPRHH